MLWTWEPAVLFHTDGSGTNAEKMECHQIKIVSGLNGGITSEVYIGLNDRAVSNTFTWTDGSHFVYNNWRYDQPNNDGDCVVLNLGLWLDRSCTTILRYICEIELAL